MPRLPDGFSLPVVTDGSRGQMMVLVVAAAVIEREGRLLVTKRQPGVHLEGYWEFPGGKCAPGETLEGGLIRELQEELAVEATVGAELLTTSHDDGERRVELHFFNCRIHGEPVPQLGQELRWIARRELLALPFPPADAELIALLARRVNE